MFTRIWINHAREEEELGDGKDVGSEQKNVARALTLLKRNKLGAAIKQLGRARASTSRRKTSKAAAEGLLPSQRAPSGRAGLGNTTGNLAGCQESTVSGMLGGIGLK